MSSYLDLRKEAKENTFYRDVLWTGEKHQIVAMCLLPGEDIPEEAHDDNEQFIIIFSGKAEITINGKSKKLGKFESADVRPGDLHHVVNVKHKPLKLITIYSPPEHPIDLVNKRQPK